MADKTESKNNGGHFTAVPQEFTRCGTFLSLTEKAVMLYLYSNAYYTHLMDNMEITNDEIRAAIIEAKAETERPTLIIGKTVMGKGALKADGSSYENNCATHGAPLGGDAYANTIKNLGGDPTNPFQIFPEVQELYAKRAAELEKIVAEKYAAKAAWAAANPDLAVKMAEWFAGKAPQVDWSAVQQKANDATRNASAAVLGVLALACLPLRVAHQQSLNLAILYSQTFSCLSKGDDDLVSFDLHIFIDRA